MIRRPIHVRLDLLDSRQLLMERDYDGNAWAAPAQGGEA